MDALISVIADAWKIPKNKESGLLFTESILVEGKYCAAAL